MRTMFRTIPLAMTMAAVAMIAACGDGSQVPAEDARQASDTSGERPSHVCGLLSRAQVDTVIPGNDGGHDRDTSEASLLKDVEMEHCSYLHVEGTDMHLLDVIIYTASSDEGFDQIDIGKKARRASVRKLDIGDIGFLDDTGDDSIVASASKGRTVFELRLDLQDANTRSEQLVELARVVAGKL